MRRLKCCDFGAWCFVTWQLRCCDMTHGVLYYNSNGLWLDILLVETYLLTCSDVSLKCCNVLWRDIWRVITWLTCYAACLGRAVMWRLPCCGVMMWCGDVYWGRPSDSLMWRLNIHRPHSAVTAGRSATPGRDQNITVLTVPERIGAHTADRSVWRRWIRRGVFWLKWLRGCWLKWPVMVRTGQSCITWLRAELVGIYVET